MESSSSAIVDFGRFCTGFLVVMGVGMVPFSTPLRLHACSKHADSKLMLTCLLAALPVLFAHCGLIEVQAMIMSIVGGLLIYGTIISFTMFFQEEQDF